MSPSAWNRKQHLHQPYYCEENVWHLLPHAPASAWALFIRAPEGPVWMTSQRAAERGRVIGWDYHVVVLLNEASPQIADLDSYADFPCSLDQYLQESFPVEAPPPSRPWFRPVPKPTYRSELRTDRRHMKRASGSWIHPPPPWPPLTPGKHNLEAWLAFDRAPDAWMDAAALRARFG